MTHFFRICLSCEVFEHDEVIQALEDLLLGLTLLDLSNDGSIIWVIRKVILALFRIIEEVDQTWRNYAIRLYIFIDKVETCLARWNQPANILKGQCSTATWSDGIQTESFRIIGVVKLCHLEDLSLKIDHFLNSIPKHDKIDQICVN